MKKKRIVLHIGFPKTGTTSLQAGFAKARGSLTEAGFCYPESVGQTNQYYLEAYALNIDRNLPTHTVLGLHTAEDLEGFRERCEADLVAEVAALPNQVDTLVFSNEGLAGLTEPEEFDRLFHLLKQVGEVEQVIAYIRRQDLNAVSNYTTYLKTGGTRRNILNKYRPGARAYIFYGDKLKLWADRLGVDRITVRHFSRSGMVGGDLFADFSDAVGLPAQVDISVNIRTNPSLSPAACAFFRAFNEAFPRFVDGKPNTMRNTVRETLETHFPGKGLLPPRDAVVDFMEQFRDSNDYIRRTWFPERSTLFDEDYSSYPEEETQPTVDEVVKVFNTVWEQRLKA
jgi:hypothetical protein